MGADQSKPKSSRHQKPAASQPTCSRSFHDVVEDEGTPVDTDVIGGQALEGGEAADGLVPEDQRLQFSLSGLPEETSECAEAELICIGKVESRYKHPKYPEDQLKEDNLSDDDQRSRQADDIDTCDISDDDKPSHEADDIDTNDIEQEKLREENNFAVCTKALPVIRNEQNQLKKKATKDIDDNRLHCADAETDNRVTEIMSNIIFLPDKTKGASPKRYGPKRLGSPGRLEDFPQVDDSSDEENKYVEQDKDKNTIGEIQRITYGDDNTREKNAKPPDVGILNNSPGEESQRGIVFVDDHFGLDTGATASGVSDCFQTGNQQTAPTADFNQNQHSQENSHNKLIGEQNTAEVITQTSSSLPDRRGMQKTFTENGIKQTTHLYNKTCETAQSLFEKNESK
ncbi:uncharacterized protein LOC128227737 isoform X2 [Mya arenaria]|uniref:uncharacterized protein LOC128227737 isoform X2 n=1 Tax=Mya arenaria TaxID=6604 RepID=UPI0022E89D42|nr:uncharacterized protein LOC128227737 isoform X2 [Mya arenaria]